MKISLKQQGNSYKRNYAQYQWNLRELLAGCLKVTALVCLFSWFFYRSIWAIPPMYIVGFLYWRKLKQEKTLQCKKDLIIQFQECIQSVAASLRAGYSVENSFLESIGDMRLLFGDDAMICRELELIQKGLALHINLEELLWDFGMRSAVGDIREFSEVFAIAKRSGGSIPEIIHSSTELIRRKIMAEDEIHTITSARRLEQKIMNAMPFGILIYIDCSTPGYFSPLYHNITGITVMSLSLIVYLGACFLAGRILEQSTSVW